VTEGVGVVVVTGPLATVALSQFSAMLFCASWPATHALLVHPTSLGPVICAVIEKAVDVRDLEPGSPVRDLEPGSHFTFGKQLGIFVWRDRATDAGVFLNFHLEALVRPEIPANRRGFLTSVDFVTHQGPDTGRRARGPGRAHPSASDQTHAGGAG
jgi:hypothetical protein